MPADYQRLSRLLDLSAGNRTITDVGDSATDFLSDGGLILASDLDIRGGDIQSTTGALTVTTGSGNLIFNPAGIITTSKAVHGIDGSAASPALTFTGDTDTGFYRSGADNLDISLGGTQRLGYSAGAFQRQTSWMRGKRLASHTGFWIVDIYVNETGVSKTTGTWYPFYA